MNINSHGYLNPEGAMTDSSSSSESETSSSSGSNDFESNNFEKAKIENELLQLPKGLCENADIFNEFFSVDTWNTLSADIQGHLLNFLPKFEENVDEENNATLQELFTGQLERFGQTPLNKLQQDLEAGNYRPDIVKINKVIAKAQRREERYQESERLSKLASALVVKREKLLRIAYASPMNAKLDPNNYPPFMNKNMELFPDSSIGMKAKRRFNLEMADIKSQIGLVDAFSDEDEELNSHEPVVKQKKRSLEVSKSTNINLKSST
jgi:nuclear factor related to kappa-B-binding protein